MRKKILKRFILGNMVLLLSVIGIYYIRIGTGKFCGSSPIVHWKFAIYTGECDDETGCFFLKMEDTGILEYLGLKKVPCPGPYYDEDETPQVVDTAATINKQDTLINHKETIVDKEHNTIVNQYASVNGCWKITNSQKIDKSSKLLEEWERFFLIDSTQTCDFSAYKLHKKVYKDGQLILDSHYYAGSEMSTEIPCGNWIYYDQGKIIKRKDFGKCNLGQFKLSK